MMQQLIDTALYYLNLIHILLASLSSLLCFVIYTASKASKKIDAIVGGLRAVLRNDIHSAYYERTDAGYCKVAEKENVRKMHHHYKCLNGNGSVDDMVDAIRALPTSKKG